MTKIRPLEVNNGHAAAGLGKHPVRQIDADDLESLLVEPLAIAPGAAAGIKDAKTVGRCPLDDSTCKGRAPLCELRGYGIECTFRERARDAVVGRDGGIIHCPRILLMHHPICGPTSFRHARSAVPHPVVKCTRQRRSLKSIPPHGIFYADKVGNPPTACGVLQSTRPGELSAMGCPQDGDGARNAPVRALLPRQGEVSTLMITGSDQADGSALSCSGTVRAASIDWEGGVCQRWYSVAITSSIGTRWVSTSRMRVCAAAWSRSAAMLTAAASKTYSWRPF